MNRRARCPAAFALLVSMVPGLAWSDPVADPDPVSTPDPEHTEAAAGAPKQADEPSEQGGEMSPQGEKTAGRGLDPAVSKVVIEAATAYLEALKTQGLGAATEHLHPQAMDQFKSMVMPALDAEQARGTRALLNATFGRDAGFMDARMATGADFLGRFARLARVRQPELSPEYDSIQPIGVLPEGERMHCLLRLKTGEGGQAVERIEVVSLSLDGTHWRVLLDGRLSGMARSLAGRASRDQRQSDRPLMEPLPEGSPLAPGALQGPAGLPPVPGPAVPPAQ